MRRVYAFSKGRVNPDSHGQWVQIDFFDGEFCCGLAGRRGNLTFLQARSIVQGHQPSAISHQPLAISHQPIVDCRYLSALMARGVNGAKYWSKN